MKLQQFNGGLSTRLAPHLLQPTESVLFDNLNNESATLKSVFDKAENGLTMDEFAHYFEASSVWEHSTTHRDYLEYQDNLYYTEPSAVPKYFDGTTHYLLGILKPSTAPTVAVGAAGALTGTYTYLITYYNSAKGVESQQSLVSAEVAVTSDKVDLSAIPVSSDAQVDKKRIYRVGGALTSFSLVDTINNADTTYTDNIADTAIPGDDFIATDYRQADSGLQYLFEAHGILFGVLNDRLYYSMTGRFWAWPAANFIDFPTTIKGAVAIGIGILVFTSYRTYIITGKSAATFSRRLFDGDQGCLSFDSIQTIKNTAIWVSSDGICSVSGSSVTVLSSDKLGVIKLDVVNSIVHNKIYYALQASGQILAYDFRYGPVLKHLSLNTSRLVVGNDILYGYYSGKYYELFAGVGQLPFTYKSPDIAEGGKTKRKTYKSVVIDSSGDITVEIFIDGVSVKSKRFTNTDVNELKIPDSKQMGYSIQIQIDGTGEVKEIDYDVNGVS